MDDTVEDKLLVTEIVMVGVWAEVAVPVKLKDTVGHAVGEIVPETLCVIEGVYEGVRVGDSEAEELIVYDADGVNVKVVRGLGVPDRVKANEALVHTVNVEERVLELHPEVEREIEIDTEGVSVEVLDNELFWVAHTEIVLVGDLVEAEQVEGEALGVNVELNEIVIVLKADIEGLSVTEGEPVGEIEVVREKLCVAVEQSVLEKVTVVLDVRHPDVVTVDDFVTNCVPVVTKDAVLFTVEDIVAEEVGHRDTVTEPVKDAVNVGDKLDDTVVHGDAVKDKV